MLFKSGFIYAVISTLLFNTYGVFAGTACSDAARNVFPVVSICEYGSATGQTVILDTYNAASHGVNKCTCGIRIDSSSNTMTVDKYNSMVPNIPGCGSSVDVEIKNRDRESETDSMTCFVSSTTYDVSESYNISVCWSQDSSTASSQYCLKLSTSSSMTISCDDVSKTSTTSSITRISTMAAETTSTLKPTMATETTSSPTRSTMATATASTIINTKATEAVSTIIHSMATKISLDGTTSTEVIITDGGSSTATPINTSNGSFQTAGETSKAWMAATAVCILIIILLSIAVGILLYQRNSSPAARTAVNYEDLHVTDDSYYNTQRYASVNIAMDVTNINTTVNDQNTSVYEEFEANAV